jgi:ATP-dependent RNA helicase RhlE
MQQDGHLSGIEIFVLGRCRPQARHGFHPRHPHDHALLPKARQNLMFSATFSTGIREWRPACCTSRVVDVAPRNTAAETVKQRVIETNREQKKDLLEHLFQARGLHQVLVFARTKHGADALARRLDKAGIKSAAIHGDKSQGARTRALTDFKDGKLVALVATDIAARGIDIDALPYVINTN